MEEEKGEAMKTKEISVSFGRTVNMGNYQALRVDVGATVTLEEGESESACFAQLWAAAEKEVAEEIKRKGGKV